VSLQSVDIEEGQTEAPDYLTESELITLMEKNGIGTDASMATHINNICERHFVTVSGQKRRLVPSVLGIAMISTYNEIDKELAGPHLRKNIEDWVNEIANGNIFGSLV
jgi:DNA topoisomerase-3